MVFGRFIIGLMVLNSLGQFQAAIPQMALHAASIGVLMKMFHLDPTAGQTGRKLSESITATGFAVPDM
jgi:hypothetical protein